MPLFHFVAPPAWATWSCCSCNNHHLLEAASVSICVCAVLLLLRLLLFLFLLLQLLLLLLFNYLHFSVSFSRLRALSLCACVCVCAVVVICCCLQFLSPKSLSTTSLSHAALCNIIKQPRPWSILPALAHSLCPTRQANLNQLSNLIAASALPFAAVVCS